LGRQEVLDFLKEEYQDCDARFLELIVRMCEIHSLKRKAYASGDSLGNFRESLRIGISPFKGCLVRLTDKVTRLYNLARNMDNPEFSSVVREETIEDTLIDLAVYSLLAIILIGEEDEG